MSSSKFRANIHEDSDAAFRRGRMSRPWSSQCHVYGCQQPPRDLVGDYGDQGLAACVMAIQGVRNDAEYGRNAPERERRIPLRQP